MANTKKFPKQTWLYRNGLSVFFITIFLITLAAQAVTGWKEHNSELNDEKAYRSPLQPTFEVGTLFQQPSKILRASFYRRHCT
jgi:hypothetical protein